MLQWKGSDTWGTSLYLNCTILILKVHTAMPDKCTAIKHPFPICTIINTFHINKWTKQCSPNPEQKRQELAASPCGELGTAALPIKQIRSRQTLLVHSMPGDYTHKPHPSFQLLLASSFLFPQACRQFCILFPNRRNKGFDVLITSL